MEIHWVIDIFFLLVDQHSEISNPLVIVRVHPDQVFQSLNNGSKRELKWMSFNFKIWQWGNKKSQCGWMSHILNLFSRQKRTSTHQTTLTESSFVLLFFIYDKHIVWFKNKRHRFKIYNRCGYSPSISSSSSFLKL